MLFIGWMSFYNFLSFFEKTKTISIDYFFDSSKRDKFVDYEKNWNNIDSLGHVCLQRGEIEVETLLEF